MHESVTTFLFTDIEGSTRLWEQEPERMRTALARHDAIARATVEANGGHVVKMTGDGLHAAFTTAASALQATLELQRALADPSATDGIELRVRCGLHACSCERRDNDFFGTGVNRAARIMSAAHGGQMLLSYAVAEGINGRLPEGVALRDLGAVRLRDLSGPERLFQVVHPALRSEFPALRSLEETPNNLPLQLTSFVGRERELEDGKQLLAKHRLLTLIGMGGMGKSRLALQVAAQVLDDYPDGVWLVELAPLQDPTRVAQAVASVLNVTEEAGRPVLEALVRFVARRRILLLLDNCEHLLDACADAARQLLQAGAGLRILATSREPLQVAGEATYPVSSLGIPPADGGDPLSHDAVRLFLERAASALPSFAVDSDNMRAVASICRQLDGIPFAIELAAARVRTLPVQQVAMRLSDRFRLLASGDRSAMPRQRTLRALIDWSYDLLSEQERRLLRQLAVFAGGWTLEAAEAVCPAEAGGESVLEVLSRLVEKSLVVVEHQGQRYRLLETVRQFATERLEEAGEGEAIRRHHFEYYARLAEAAKPELVGADQAAWLDRLDAERENILLAHAWAVAGGVDPQKSLELLICVKLYWINRGLLQLGHRVTAEALAREPEGSRSMTRERGLFAVGQFCSFMGRYEEARAALREALSIARDHRDERAIAVALQALGMATYGTGDFPAARAYLEEGYAMAKRRGDSRALASVANELAQLQRIEGHLEAARPLYREVLHIAREMRDAESVAIGLLNLAMLEISDGNVGVVPSMLLEAMQIMEELRSRRLTQSVLEVCAGLAAAMRDWEHAARFYGAAETQAGNTGLQREPADEAFLAPLMQISRHAAGETAFSRDESAGRALAHADAMRVARDWLRSR